MTDTTARAHTQAQTSLMCSEPRPHPPHTYVAWRIGEWKPAPTLDCPGVPGRRDMYPTILRAVRP